MLIERQKNYNMFTCIYTKESCAFIYRVKINNLKFIVIIIYLLNHVKMG